MEKAALKLATFYKKHRRMPSYAEAAKLLGYKTKSAVAYALKRLVDRGLVERDQSTGRLLPGKLLNEIKLLGLVEAGFPSPAEEELLDTISFDDYLTPNKESSYILKVKGESMKDAGINDGDMVIVERRQNFKPGQIVIASIDGEYTMKYLRKTGNKYYLEPANRAYQDIIPKDGETLAVEAVVTAVVRKY